MLLDTMQSRVELITVAKQHHDLMQFNTEFTWRAATGVNFYHYISFYSSKMLLVFLSLLNFLIFNHDMKLLLYWCFCKFQTKRKYYFKVSNSLIFFPYKTPSKSNPTLIYGSTSSHLTPKGEYHTKVNKKSLQS